MIHDAKQRSDGDTFYWRLFLRSAQKCSMVLVSTLAFPRQTFMFVVTENRHLFTNVSITSSSDQLYKADYIHHFLVVQGRFPRMLDRSGGYKTKALNYKWHTHNTTTNKSLTLVPSQGMSTYVDAIEHGSHQNANSLTIVLKWMLCQDRHSNARSVLSDYHFSSAVEVGMIIQPRQYTTFFSRNVVVRHISDRNQTAMYSR